jgi:hypothetical protein
VSDQRQAHGTGRARSALVRRGGAVVVPGA